MKAKIKQSITTALAIIAFVFIIISSIVQWVPRIYDQTSKEAKYTLDLHSFLQTSPQFARYIEDQNEEPENEKK